MFRLLCSLFLLLSLVGIPTFQNSVTTLSEDVLAKNNFEDCNSKTCIRKCCNYAEYITNERKCKNRSDTNQLKLNVSVFEGKKLLSDVDLLYVLPPMEQRNIITAPEVSNYHWCDRTIRRFEFGELGIRTKFRFFFFETGWNSKRKEILTGYKRVEF